MRSFLPDSIPHSPSLLHLPLPITRHPFRNCPVRTAPGPLFTPAPSVPWTAAAGTDSMDQTCWCQELTPSRTHPASSRQMLRIKAGSTTGCRPWRALSAEMRSSTGCRKDSFIAATTAWMCPSWGLFIAAITATAAGRTAATGNSGPSTTGSRLPFPTSATAATTPSTATAKSCPCSSMPSAQGKTIARVSITATAAVVSTGTASTVTVVTAVSSSCPGSPWDISRRIFATPYISDATTPSNRIPESPSGCSRTSRWWYWQCLTITLFSATECSCPMPISLALASVCPTRPMA